MRIVFKNLSDGAQYELVIGPEATARATQAVLDYFKANPEAGEPPLLHHRDGIAKAVLVASTHEPTLMMVHAGTIETVDNVYRVVRTQTRVVDLIFSPDDGGYYLHEYDIPGSRDRLSKKVWANRADAERSLRAGTVKWERWS